jgi:AcrR family transcriptional regulator
VSVIAERTVAGPEPSVLVAAERLLRTEGPHGLSLRRIAELAGTSTQAVYTQFGGKAGLADALYREGYRRLDEGLAEVDTTLEPLERIRALSEAYRSNALAHPHLYEVMTGRPLPEYDPPAASRRRARRTLQPLIDALAEAVDRGELVGDPREIAGRMWAAGHGFVSLVIHGLDAAGDVEDRYRALTESLITGHRPPGAPTPPAGSDP